MPTAPFESDRSGSKTIGNCKGEHANAGGRRPADYGPIRAAQHSGEQCGVPNPSETHPINRTRHFAQTSMVIFTW
jgi:hypothetical protein